MLAPDMREAIAPDCLGARSGMAREASAPERPGDAQQCQQWGMSARLRQVCYNMCMIDRLTC